MATIPARQRADQAILKRQQEEFVHESRMANEADSFKFNQKALFENKTAAVIRSNNVRDKALAMRRQHEEHLQNRRALLADKLAEERQALEQEMVDKEDERKAIVQDKLYQQWRSGLDDVRVMDSNIVQLQTIADRDAQLDEKAVRAEEEKRHHEFYDKLWHEGYLAKIEREKLEKEAEKERKAQMINVLEIQRKMKEDRVEEERVQEAYEASEVKKVWAAQEQAEKDALVLVRIRAREDRAKTDEYMAVQKAHRDAEEREEKGFDKAFVEEVIARERRLAEIEEAEKKKANQKARAFTEALKIEMARKAESEEQLVRLQHEESERQWQKRYDKWEKEELARRKLMEEVYADRARQLQQKEELRAKLKTELVEDKAMIDEEQKRLDGLEAARLEGEKALLKKQQESYLRQMDHQQVARQRREHQDAIEKRQSAMAENKISRAVEKERVESQKMMADILEKRNAVLAAKKSGTVAPWDK
jgi:trichoplein keratin filament-binding protein